MMKKATSVILTLFLIGMFLTVLTGCGADIKAENEKLKTENTNLKSENDKLKLDVQKLKEDIQKAAAAAAEKDTTIGNLKTESEALKKQVEDLTAKLPKKKK
jgi:peptidoglycan hydrolase CwlO-like protein